MCGRMAFDFTHTEVKSEYKIDVVMKEFSPNYNVAPTHDVPVIVAGSRILNMYKWGLIPHWAKDSKIGFKLINARGETLEDKPSFRDAFHKSRCVIICSGFFEWKNKKPHYFVPNKGKMFALAGLASAWKDKKGKIIQSCTVITTKPNKLVKNIHDRMPVILEDKDIDNWINPEYKNIDSLNSLLKPYEENKMKEFEVSSEINSVKNNNKDLLNPIKPEKQSAL